MTNTEQYIQQLVEEELEKTFIQNIVEIASECKAPGFREMLIEETLEFLIERKLQQYEN